MTFCTPNYHIEGLELQEHALARLSQSKNREKKRSGKESREIFPVDDVNCTCTVNKVHSLRNLQELAHTCTYLQRLEKLKKLAQLSKSKNCEKR